MRLNHGEKNGNDHDEQLLDELLLELEEMREQGASGSTQQLLDQPTTLAIGPVPERLVAELERRLEALQDVDQFLFPARKSRPASWPEIDGYQLLGELDRGGMGVVYLARQLTLDREVAVKVLLSGRHAGPRLRGRFQSEAATLARLRHPNIVQIFDSGQTEGVPYLALELVDGGSLKKGLGGRPQPSREAVQLVQTIARAVHYAHQQGVVHRDLKSSNVLISADGVPKITDFGLAKLLKDDANLTRTGETPGTPSYMAPEQIRSGAVGPQADVYAVGAILYECLTGRPPFSAESSADVLNQVLTEDPVPPRRLQPNVARDLEIICLKCLEKEVSRRYATAAAVADEMQRFLLGKPIRARAQGPLGRAVKWTRRRPAAATLMAVSVLAISAIWSATFWHSRALSTAFLASEQHRLTAEASEQRSSVRSR